MNGFSFLLLMFAAFFVYRAVENFADKSEMAHGKREEIERIRLVIERDPSNSGTRAQYAAHLVDRGDLAGGIHEYRVAISTTPQGPFTDNWKRKLKEALEIQEMLARGERPPGFNEWRVCRRCQATLALNAKTCPKCGDVLQMGTVQWLQSDGVARDIWRQSWPFALVLWIAAILFSTLPREWQGVLIMASVLVAGWLFLRSFNL